MNMLSCQMVQLSNGGLKTGQKMHILWFKMSILSHDQTIWKLDKKVLEKLNVRSSGVRYSYDYCSQAF